MGTVIYYFSGTGNSLVVARDIAGKIKAELIPIPSVIDEEIVNTDAEVMGVVFPVYHQGIPFIIKRFIDKMDNLNKKYIFGVCTYGDSPGISLVYLDKMIRSKGGKLAAGFAVNMPYNYITPSFVLNDFFRSFVLREITIEKQQKIFSDWEKRLNSICEFVLSKEEGKLEKKAKIIEDLVDFINLRETLQKKIWLKIADFKGHTDLCFLESIHLMDHGFKCGDPCNHCGICSKICPVKNIQMMEGTPIWQHRCEQCFACLQWCPKEAIQFSNRTSYGKRYHHPDVKLSDMMIHDKKQEEIKTGGDFDECSFNLFGGNSEYCRGTIVR